MKDIENVVSIYVNDLFREYNNDHLSFHNMIHIQEVVKNVTLIGKHSGASKDDILLLRTAAWFHDVGVTVQYKNHETESIAIARDFLNQLNCEPRFIDVVAELIDATRMPQNPKTLLSEMICDADLAHLANKKYHLYAGRLRQEWAHFLNKRFSDAEWNKFNLSFLKNHRYFTPYGQMVMAKQKQLNIARLAAVN
ncbi:HD domain-containing protein [Mucilaginibacter rubeus]|uniref:HD domain-containing protein n=1 Tax=Mucilaginibacter rubeus TaxID=2027860 RepID=A0AAE6JIQ5_9SPHI|nr:MULTISPECIES: HD domain-containing protein [Mucilaginibacter]QEM06449.1 HD domain-containing protein [Mucilaginibacter rubeus]QEM19035.1 HD domain-containing protein [Mucilaginibacter gossypii]QTE44424.1 HD domain-containing protein [Mucilaginibacter rubeus]QTE51023.1 HD domain-containing protein [Mucilaginibacter rubeus]QTE56106.1 HD domain-containing protein [Mucilaginibacter rubeus]